MLSNEQTEKLIEQVQNWSQKFPVLPDFLAYLFAQTLIAISAWLMLLVGIFDFVKGTIRPRRLNAKNVVITGASSGIGAALATEYAKPGVTLGLIGRNLDRVNQVAEACRSKGATVECMIVDVTDGDKLADLLSKFDASYPVDLLIANAGITGRILTGKKAHELGETDFVDMLKPIADTNYTGVISTMLPLLKKFIERRRGQIGVVSSIAGLLPFPNYPAYSTSKVAVSALCQSMRPALERFNVSVNLICPGYVESAMTAGLKNVGALSASTAARFIRDGLERDIELIAFPLHVYLQVKIISLLPYRLRSIILTTLWRVGYLPQDEAGFYSPKKSK